MRPSVKSSALFTAIVLGATAAGAEEIHFKQICQDVGGQDFTRLGDRDGHGVSVNTYSCRIEGGPMDGALLTGDTIAEWDKTDGRSLSGNAVVRKPGGFAVYQDGEGTFKLTMAEGKITGITGGGNVHYIIATGSAAPLAGKTVVYTVRSTGPSQWEADGTVQ